MPEQIELATILKVLNNLSDKVDQLIDNKGLMTIAQAHEYLSIGENRLREECKKKPHWAVQVGGNVHRYFLIDPIAAKRDFIKRGILKCTSL